MAYIGRRETTMKSAPSRRQGLTRFAGVASVVWLVLFVALSRTFYSHTLQIAEPEVGGRYLVDLFAGGLESWSTGEIMLASALKAGCMCAAGLCLSVVVLAVIRYAKLNRSARPTHQ